MPKLLLLRVYAESSNGGYYSPIHSGCYTTLWIPEKKPLRMIPERLLPENIKDECTGKPLSDYYSLEHRGRPVHRDPRLDLGFYTDYYMPMGRLPSRDDKRLGPGDLLLFMAGLAKYPGGLWDKPRRLAEVKRAFREAVRRGWTGIYIVGGIIIEEVIDIGRAGWKRAIGLYDILQYSPHYYRVNDKPVAIIGRGFKLNPPLQIGGRSGPTMHLIRVIGSRDAEMTARNNYRRSRVLRIASTEAFIDEIRGLAMN